MLYLLDEIQAQVDFTTKAKYLYNSEFHSLASGYLDQTGKNYAYLSYTHGLIDPEEDLSPYPLKKLSLGYGGLWTLMVYVQIAKRVEDFGKICLLYSGRKYKSLENLLEENYALYKPFEGLSNNKLKVSWINDIIKNEIESRLKNNF